MSKTARKHGAVTRVQHQVRIIGGQWKRTPLPVLDAAGLRPTPDRVRETVFNWITHLINGSWQERACLDLFAGSGALGFESASRGARRVVMVDHHGAAVRQLEASKDKLKAEQVEILRGDALALLQGFVTCAKADEKFDLIFADPPYHQDWLVQIMPLCEQVLAPLGLLYVESEQALQEETGPVWMASWELVRIGQAGRVFYHLLRRKKIDA